MKIKAQKIKKLLRFAREYYPHRIYTGEDSYDHFSLLLDDDGFIYLCGHYFVDNNFNENIDLLIELNDFIKIYNEVNKKGLI